jgi:hypothetical protein
MLTYAEGSEGACALRSSGDSERAGTSATDAQVFDAILGFHFYFYFYFCFRGCALEKKALMHKLNFFIYFFPLACAH